MKPHTPSALTCSLLAVLLCLSAGPALAGGNPSIARAAPGTLATSLTPIAAPRLGDRLLRLASNLRDEDSRRLVSLFRGSELVWSGPAREMETELNSRILQTPSTTPNDRLALGHTDGAGFGTHCALVEGHIYIGEDGRLKKEPDTVVCDDI